eukprot:2471022-Rhodomonas_salina.6
MRGTELAYGATRRLTRLELSGSSLRPQGHLYLCDVRVWCHAMCAGLRACYAMPGTDIAYAAVWPGTCYTMSGTDIAKYQGPWSLLGSYSTVRAYNSWYATSLRAYHAIRGTELACGAVSLRVCYAVMCGTELAYAAIFYYTPASGPVMERVGAIRGRNRRGGRVEMFWSAMPLAACYAMPGTEIAYGSGYARGTAMPGTGIAYRAI